VSVDGKTGKWKLETGKSKLESRKTKLENGKMKIEILRELRGLDEQGGRAITADCTPTA
jgi:hypothetical protein